MVKAKVPNLVFVFVVIASLVLSGGAPVAAQGSKPPVDASNTGPAPAVQDGMGGSLQMEQMAAMAKAGPPPPGKKGQGNGQMRSMTQAERQAAALKRPNSRKGVSASYAGLNKATLGKSALSTNVEAAKKANAPTGAATALATMSGALSTPDVYGVANWANSPFPTLDALGQLTGGMQKFVNTLPGICGISPWGANGTNEIGQCIPLAAADATTFPAIPAANGNPAVPPADYYEIGLVEYNEQLHRDLPLTRLRGYVQLALCGSAGAVPLTLANGLTTNVTYRDGTPACGVTKPQYLGPMIVAASGRPARVKFVNLLPLGGGAVVTANISNGQVQPFASANIANGGSNYTAAANGVGGSTVVIDPPGGCTVNCATATAVVSSVDASGAITGLTLTNPGSGYTIPPLVTIVGAPGDLQIPTDTTYMGAGDGDYCADGTPATATSTCPRAIYLENRATLHLHGGNTPWISDGTPHQWTVPAGDSAHTPYKKGVSAANVPDMWFDAAGNLLPASSGCQGQTACGVAGATTDPGPGSLTFYWTNQQGGRLMFYHDHAYGTTRLNVYAGEAAGYLLADPNSEAMLQSATVPGTVIKDPATGALIGPDTAHLVPLVIQDKSFVPDDGAAGGQLAATDPTWDTVHFGGKGSLWFPHVYVPNQNPADETGANPVGRWDYGPWFWPPQDPRTLVLPPFGCDSAAYSNGNGVAFPPLLCPGIRNPSGVPEGFMDTTMVNGTPYPTLTVDPVAYRFQILSAGNDRTLNLGLYVADPLAIAITNPGSGYDLAAPPAVTIDPPTKGSITSATARVSTGQVTSILVTGVGSGYTSTTPTVTIDPPTGCTINTTTCVQATATAVISPGVGQVTAINVINPGAGYTTTPNVTVQDSALIGCQSGCLQATAAAQLTPAGEILGIDVVLGTDTSWDTNPKVTIAAPTAGTTATATASANTEVKMVNAFPHTASDQVLPLCPTPTQTSGAMLALATLDSNGNPINNTGLPLTSAGLPCWPSTWPTDARDGGVPDPGTAGPPIIQIGTEGGLLPQAVVIPSTPVGYEYNRRSITVLNVFTHGLLLGPAERADAILDFSAFAGKKLILYNDAPAPVPAFDPRNDYYTGNPDQTSTGGAPSTMPGYGPNTRTVMQIKVNPLTTPPQTNNFNLKSVMTALPGIFASTQDAIIVPEPAYPPVNGGGPAKYVKIQDTTLTSFVGGPIGLKLTSGGAGYTSVPNVSIAPPVPAGSPCPTGLTCVQATATALLSPSSVAGVALSPGGGGSGYTSAPQVTIAPPTGPGGVTATATASLAPTGSIGAAAVTASGNGFTCSTLNFSFPAPPTPGGVIAQGTVTIANRRVTSVTVTNPGSGYTTNPVANVNGCGGTGARVTGTVGKAVASIQLAANGGGSGYTAVPNVTIAPPQIPGTTATGFATLSPTVVASLQLTNPGNGYRSVPQVTIAPPASGTQATAVATAPTVGLEPKTIQELFTLDYGKMNATLGVEIPKTNFQTQTTIPYGYVDPPTEIFQNGETQIWKITHNGVDTHFIHFHLFNVQVINRVGWDGAVKPPDANELSWKDTVRMNPLEDIIVALRPLQQTLPWKLGNSVRPLDVTNPVNSTSTMLYTNVDPTGQPATVINAMTNFGWEYVWHCHILGHEENDMMRAMILGIPPANPGTPTAQVTGNGNSQKVTLTWADNSNNETSFTIERSTNGGAWAVVGTVTNPVLPGVGSSTGPVTWTDSGPLARRTTYTYRITANNRVGYTQTYAAPTQGYFPQTYSSAPTAASTPVTTQ